MTECGMMPLVKQLPKVLARSALGTVNLPDPNKLQDVRMREAARRAPARAGCAGDREHVRRSQP